MISWWRGSSEQRYAVGAYCLVWVLMALLPLIQPPPSQALWLVYLDKLAIFWAITLMLGGWFLAQKRQYRKEALGRIMGDRPLVIVVVGLTVCVILSYVFAPDKATALLGVPPNFTGLISYLMASLFVLLLLPAVAMVPWRKWLEPAYISFSLLAVVIHIQVLWHDFLLNQGHGIQVLFFAGLGNRNYAAGPYAILFLSQLVDYVTSPRPRRRVVVIPLLVSFSTVLLSLTRAAWVGVFVAVVAFAIVTLSGKQRLLRVDWRTIAVLCLAMVVILCVVNTLDGGAVIGRLLYTVDEVVNSGGAGMDEVSSQRLSIWRQGLRLLTSARTLLIGVGPNSAGLALGDIPITRGVPWQYIPAEFDGRDVVRTTNLHNQYLETVATLGVPAALFAAGLLVLLLRRASAATGPEATGLWLCMVYLMTNWCFISINAATSIYLLPLVACIAARRNQAPPAHQHLA